jgi:Periplasmic component of the Tol biopolymer transport system
LRKVTEGLESSLDPDISPEGERLIYHRDRDGNERFQVIVRDLGSGREEDITGDHRYYHMSAKFNPDGERVAFTSNRGGRPAQLHVYQWGSITEVTRWNDPIFYFNWISSKELVYFKGFYHTEIRLVNIEDGVDRLLLHFEKAETFIGGFDVKSMRALFYTNVDEWFDIGELEVDSGMWRCLHDLLQGVFLSGYDHR